MTEEDETEQMRRDLIDLVSRLVEIPSVNPDLVPDGGGEGELARFVANWLEQAGVETVVTEVAPGRPNVVAIVRGTGGGRGLMLNAHLDTVGAGGMTDPFTPRVEGNRLYGRGAFDMKASLAAIMLVAAAAKEQSWRGDLVVTAVVDEEYGSIGTAAVAANSRLMSRVEAAIVTEPTGLDLCIAHNGFVWFTVTTHGVAAHGSRPDLGTDAIARMGPILTAITAYDQVLQRRPRATPRYPASIHASTIHGGQELSSYPRSCVLEIERRTTPEEAMPTVIEEFERLVQSVTDTKPPISATLSTGLSRDGYAISPDAPIVQILARQIEAQTGRTPDFVAQSGWMDSALLGAAGVPTVIFGPDGGGAHGDLEWVDLDQTQQTVDTLFAVAAEFCG
jgi:acetylornithine deacetylase